MEVLKTIWPDKNDDSHSIEWGYGTWAKDWHPKTNHRSIRNRFNKDDGGFNIRGSAEVPWNDFKTMIEQSIILDQFSKKEIRRVLKLSFQKAFQNLFKRDKR